MTPQQAHQVIADMVTALSDAPDERLSGGQLTLRAALASTGTPLYTADQVTAALEEGADLVKRDDIGSGERDADLIGIVTAAQSAVLKRPEITLDDVLAESFPSDVRTWWVNWS